MTGDGEADHYAVLGVPRDASAYDIRRAYRGAARKHHPDHNPRPGGAERFAAAAHSYEVLSDPAARARYDERCLIRRTTLPARPPLGAGRRGVLELTAREGAHLERLPLTLTDAHGGTIVLPAGTRDGDHITLRHRDQLAVLRVLIERKG